MLEGSDSLVVNTQTFCSYAYCMHIHGFALHIPMQFNVFCMFHNPIRYNNETQPLERLGWFLLS